MIMGERLEIALAGQSPVDPRLVATLNRFHFTAIRLVGSRSARWVLYHDGPLFAGTAAEFALLHDERRGYGRLEGENGDLVYPMPRPFLALIADYLAPYWAGETQVNLRRPQHPAERPGMDQVADDLEAWLRGVTGWSGPVTPRRFGLAITHDVDVTGRSWLANWKSSLVFFINVWRVRHQPEVRRFYLDLAWRFGLGRVDYHGFDHLLELAGRHDYRPQVFFYARLPGHNGLAFWQRWLELDPNYDIGSPYLRRMIAGILAAGGEIGLHGSFLSAANPELLQREKARLESLTGQPCRCVRQHYLNFFAAKTLRAYSALGLTLESNAGFALQSGYMAGTTRPFYAWLPEASGQKVVGIPMVFMDGVPLYFEPRTGEGVLAQVAERIAWLRHYGGMGAVNFHQRLLSAIPAYRDVVDALPGMVRQAGGEVVTLPEVDRLFPPETPHG